MVILKISSLTKIILLLSYDVLYFLFSNSFLCRKNWKIQDKKWFTCSIELIVWFPLPNSHPLQPWTKEPPCTELLLLKMWKIKKENYKITSTTKRRNWFNWFLSLCSEVLNCWSYKRMSMKTDNFHTTWTTLFHIWAGKDSRARGREFETQQKIWNA